jgi:hypothetical protein
VFTDKVISQITDEIYIGYRDAVGRDNVPSMPNIKSCLNVAYDEKRGNDTWCRKAGLIDGDGNQVKWLVDAVNIMEEQINEYGNVMVFCVRGVSRSPMVVIAYLCIKRGMDLQEAFSLVLKKRRAISINPYLSYLLLVGLKEECCEPVHN